MDGVTLIWRSLVNDSVPDIWDLFFSVVTVVVEAFVRYPCFILSTYCIVYTLL